MSSILKALKKLEEEKVLQQETGGINVSREILRQQPESRKIVLWLWIASIVALAIIATLATLLLIKPPLKNGAPPSSAALPPREPAVPLPAAAIVPTPLTSNNSITVSSPLSAPEEKKPQQIRPALSPSQPTADKNSRTELPASHFPSPEALRPDFDRKPLKPSVPDQSDISLTLSGIAWNKDSSDRLAIINGQPTAIGATVNGVVIEEILPDRVKVNSAGRSFEIFLGKSARSN